MVMMMMMMMMMITNRLIGGYQLKRILTFRNGPKKLVRNFLRSLTGHAGLRSSEIVTSSRQRR